MTGTRRDGEPASGGPAGARQGAPDGRPGPSGDTAAVLEGIRALHGRLDDLERRMAAGGHQPAAVARPAGGGSVLPAWKRPTRGEARWQVTLAVAAAVALQLPVPGRLVLVRPGWLLPVAEALLLVVLVAASPRRIDRRSHAIRLLSLTFAALLSLANAWSVALLVRALIDGSPDTDSAGSLLATGGVIWLTATTSTCRSPTPRRSARPTSCRCPAGRRWRWPPRQASRS